MGFREEVFSRLDISCPSAFLYYPGEDSTVVLPNSCGVFSSTRTLRFVKAQGKIGQLNCGTTVMECYVATKKKKERKK